MADGSSIFSDDTTVGGVPWFTSLIQRCLPKDKKKREKSFRIQMYILTYVIYAVFNITRRPTAVAKSKILDECNATTSSAATTTTGPAEMSSSHWCSETFFDLDSSTETEEFMGFLDGVYLLAYGVCLFLSGVIADCYNPRFYLTMGCILSGFFCALLGLFNFWHIRNFDFYTVILILAAGCQSTSWPVLLSSVTHWLTGRRRGLFFGLWNTHNYVGSILGIYIAGLWVDAQWGMAFFVSGCILALTAFVVLSFLVIDPDDLKELDKEPVKISKRRLTNLEVPSWLGQSRSITLYDAINLPGVMAFSGSMFFSRMVGYTFIFWLPTFIKMVEEVTSRSAALCSLAYFLGGSIGGVVSGFLVDSFKRSALVSTGFLLTSIPVLAVGLWKDLGENPYFDFPIFMLIGIFVEAPYVVTSTSVSADLGKHKMIKRNHRAISTIGGIVEGTGAIGAAFGTSIAGVILMRSEWANVVYMMMVMQFLAALCISKYAYYDIRKKQKAKTTKDYWRSSTLNT